MISRLLRLAILLGCLLAVKPALGATTSNCPTSGTATTFTTCRYVDYNSGSDSNDGLSEMSGHPWKHMPGMMGTTPSGTSTGDGCTGNCASFTPKGGTAIILKGGSTWPNTVFPLTWSWSGSGTSSSIGCQGTGCIYIGIDPGWNQGTVNAVIPSRDLGGCPSGGVTATISGGGGSGATAVATTIGGAPDFAGGQYLVAYYTVTNPGNGYTSNPTVTVSGSGCTSALAVADIQRPIFDLGSGSGVTWNYTQTFPGLINARNVNYIIFDNLDVRDIQWTSAGNGCNYTCEPNLFAVAQTPYATVSNVYLHNFGPVIPLYAGGGNDGDEAIRLSCNGMTCYTEAANNWIINGQQAYTGTGAAQCPSGNGGSVCGMAGEGAISATYVHDNHLAFNAWQIAGSNFVYHNEVWATVEQNAAYFGGHTNIFYELNGGFGVNFYIYNNLWYNNDAGAFSQMSNYNNGSFHVFNNVCPLYCGAEGATFVVDPTGASSNGGGAFNLYYFNNTVNAGTGLCMNIGASGTNFGQMYIWIYNNQCFTDQSSYGNWYLQQGTAPYELNGATGPTVAMASLKTSGNVVMTPTAAAAAGYTPASLLQLPSSGNAIGAANAQGPNLASYASNCSSSSSSLYALCSNINGLGRNPTAANWGPGAYYTSSTVTPVAPPLSLVAVPH